MDCSQGHSNPETAAFCSTCGERLGVGPVPPERSPRRVLVLGLVAAVTLLVAAGATWSALDRAGSEDTSRAAEPETMVVSGTLALTDDEMQNPSYDAVLEQCDFDAVCEAPEDEPCAPGSVGYSDIAAGAQVSVTDSSGDVIAIGALEPGRTGQVEDVWGVESEYPPCYFGFRITDVPVSGATYGVEVGQRGTVYFTQDEAESISISLGD